MMRAGTALIAATMLVACGQPASTTSPPAPTENPATSETVARPAELPPVEAENLAAPNTGFTAVEPSELGVSGAATVREALAPLLSSDVNEGANLQLSIVETGDASVADIVRSGLEDDSVSAAHLRLEFRKETDGWYPTNAYRRMMCARGDRAGQWSATPCP